jgi:RHS repeat-associated protein
MVGSGQGLSDMVNKMKNGIFRALTLALFFLCALLVSGEGHAQATVEYIHTDALGTPVAVTNTTGVVIERSEYEPYGQLVNRPLTDGPGFTGHVQDAATGLTYMQQRYYDPVIGRFLSVDPVTAYENSDWRHFNRYVYAYDNPYGFTDPDGRCPFCPSPGVIAQARAAQATRAAERHAAEPIAKAAPRSGIVELGATAAAGTGQLGGAVQGSVGAMNNGKVTINAIYVTGGIAGKGTDGSVSLPSSSRKDSTFVAGASKGAGIAAGLTNASTGAELEGQATLYQLNTTAGSLNFSLSESGIWTATIGTPDAGVSAVKQPVYTKIIVDHEKSESK